MGDTNDDCDEAPNLIVTSEMRKLTSTQVTWHLKEWNKNAEFLKDNSSCIITLKEENAEEIEEDSSLSEIKLRFFLKDIECKMGKKLKRWYSLWVALISEQGHVTFEVDVTEEEDGDSAEQVEEEETAEDDEEDDDDEDEEIQVKSQVTLGSGNNLGENVEINPGLVKEDFILMSWWKLDDSGDKIGSENLSEWAEAEEIKLKIKVTMFKYFGSDIEVKEDNENNEENEDDEINEEVEIIPIIRDLKEMFSQEENYSDLLLETRDGTILNCHRFVLAARSPYFKGVLEKEVKKKGWAGVIKLGNVDGKAMSVILHWMYSDEMHEDMGKVMDEVIKVSVKWELGDLLKLLDKKLVTACTTRNMMHLFQVAHKYGLFTAIEDISRFIKENIDSVVPTRKSSITT